jgi:hypothetical protein
LVLDALSAPAAPSPVVDLQNETCNTEGITEGIASVDLGAAITTGEYRVLAEGRGEITRGQIPSSGQVAINLGAGTYLLELTADGCTFPIQNITISAADQVEFTVPKNLNICEIFTLIPDTDQGLNFTLTFPNGIAESITSGGSFTLTEAGTSSILGVTQNENTSRYL